MRAAGTGRYSRARSGHAARRRPGGGQAAAARFPSTPLPRSRSTAKFLVSYTWDFIFNVYNVIFLELNLIFLFAAFLYWATLRSRALVRPQSLVLTTYLTVTGYDQFVFWDIHILRLPVLVTTSPYSMLCVYASRCRRYQADKRYSRVNQTRHSGLESAKTETSRV